MLKNGDATLQTRQAQMPDLRRTSPATPIDFPVDAQAAADAGADRDVENRRKSLAGAEERFGEAGDVGVVAQRRGQAHEIANPVREREIVPAVNLVRLDDGASGVVHGAAEADADAAQLPALDSTLGKQLRHGLNDLFANAVGAARYIDGTAPQPCQDAVAAAQSELQFRAADFNAEEHDVCSPLSLRERGQLFPPFSLQERGRGEGSIFSSVNLPPRLAPRERETASKSMKAARDIRLALPLQLTYRHTLRSLEDAP